MILPSLLFFCDFFVFSVTKNCFFCALLAYFIVLCVKRDTGCVQHNNRLYGVLFLLLLQDFFVGGRFGLGLVSLLFPLIFIPLTKNVARVSDSVIFALFTLFVLFLQDFVIKSLFFGHDTCINSTIMKFFITLIVGYLVLFGMRGNRSF